MDTINKFIVAEVSKSWGENIPKDNTLSQEFEKVININDSRDYKLIEWKINVSYHDYTLIETIIAIFELKE